MRSAILTIVGMSLLLAGCEPDYVGGELTTEVHGIVTMDGQPIEDAHVIFIPQTIESPSGKYQEIAYGLTDAQGNFTLTRANGAKGAFKGMHRVLISKKEKSERKGPANEPALDKDDLDIGSLTNGSANKDSSKISDTNLIETDVFGMRRQLAQPDDEKIPIIYNLQSTLTFDVETTLNIVRAKFELSSVDPILTEATQPARD